MGIRERNVFMTRKDEDKFIKYWRAQKVIVILPHLPMGAATNPLTRSPVKGYLDRGVLYITSGVHRPKIVRGKWQGARNTIDSRNSDVISYCRGSLFKGTIGIGTLSITTYDRHQRKPDYLVKIWNDLIKWMDKNYYKLPDNDGYLGPDAVRFAATKIDAATNKHVYIIRRNRKRAFVTKIDKSYEA